MAPREHEPPPDDVMAPKGVLHYQSGPVVAREVVYDGQRWFVTWLAERDIKTGGWRVISASTRHLGPAPAR